MLDGRRRTRAQVRAIAHSAAARRSPLALPPYAPSAAKL